MVPEAERHEAGRQMGPLADQRIGLLQSQDSRRQHRGGTKEHRTRTIQFQEGKLLKRDQQVGQSEDDEGEKLSGSHNHNEQ